MQHIAAYVHTTVNLRMPTPGAKRTKWSDLESLKPQTFSWRVLSHASTSWHVLLSCVCIICLHLIYFANSQLLNCSTSKPVNLWTVDAQALATALLKTISAIWRHVPKFKFCCYASVPFFIVWSTLQFLNGSTVQLLNWSTSELLMFKLWPQHCLI